MKPTRPIAGGLLALTVIGVGVVAEPASAQAPGNADSTPGGTTQAQTTETFDQQRAREDAQEDIRKAIGRAKLLTRVPACRDYFGTGSTVYDGLDAQAVLGNLEIDQKIVNKYDTPGPKTEEGGVTVAQAERQTGTMTFFKEYFDKSANSISELDRMKFDPPLSSEDWQALILLHELAHVFGKSHDRSSESNRLFEDALAKACFNSSKPKPPPPPPLRGGIGGGFTDAAIGAPLYTVPEFVVVDPLPNGAGDINIGDDFIEVDPEEPDPLPDDDDIDNPCFLDPLACGGGGGGNLGYGGGYDPYGGGGGNLGYGGGYDPYGAGRHVDPWSEPLSYESELQY